MGQRTPDDHVSTVISLLQDVSDKKWEIARELGSIDTEYGEADLKRAARQCKMPLPTAYDYVKVWRVFGRLKEYERPRNLFFAHYVIATRAPDSNKALELIHYAADEDLSTQPFDRYVQERGNKEEWDRCVPSPEKP